MQIVHKNNQKKMIIVFFSILMIILIGLKIYNNIISTKTLAGKEKLLLDNINSSSLANVTKYSVYGTNFNIEGTLDLVQISGIKVKYVDIILKNSNKKEYEAKCSYTYQDNLLSFSTFDKLNDSLNIDNLFPGTYYAFLKVYFSNGDTKFYSFSNTSKEDNITYYSITKNNTNNKIEISFDNYNSIPYLFLSVESIKSLPDDIYDIAIDPGHGGLDKGAKKNEYTEAELVLKCSLALKEKLESLGFKVFISRNGSENPDEDTSKTMYNENGRINIINKSKAKLMISLHIKDDLYSKKNGGIEVYAPNNCNLNFASDLAKTLVEKTNSYYSELNKFKNDSGVYVRNYTNTDIISLEARAKRSGYEPYLINTSTPYLYIIREIGGISTNAYVDGRNKSYGTNLYCNSNYGIEGYKVYLGYIDIEKDLTNIASNYNLYAEAICESIKNYLMN